MEDKFLDNSQNHTLYLGNCLTILDQLPNNICNLIFADPPYNMRKNFGNNKDTWNTINEYVDWCKNWVDLCIQKLTYNGSIVIMGHPHISSYLVPYLDEKLHYTNQIVYYYTDGMPEKKNFERRYEMLLYYRKNQENYIFNPDSIRTPLVRYDKFSNPKGKIPNDVWQIHRVRWNSKERISQSNGKIKHPTQKPIRLLRRIILGLSNPNDIILDPFLGTGTTSVAAKELGRKSIGIEINKDFLQSSLERLNNTKIINSELDYEKR